MVSADEEEQLMECEALQSIYPTEFTVLSDKVPREYTLNVSHSTTQGDVYTIQLHIHLPAQYPSTDPCTVIVHSISGISNDACQPLQSGINDQIADLHAQGSVAIFVLAQYAQDWLNDYKAEPVKQAAAAVEDVQTSQIKQPSPLGIEAGTIVTMDSFRAWKALFAAEQAALATLHDSSKVQLHRMTGKQLFMQNLVSEEAEESDADGADVDYSRREEGEEVDTAQINTALFDDDDVLDDT